MALCDSCAMGLTSKGELKKRMFGLDCGALTSFEIEFLMKQHRKRLLPPPPEFENLSAVRWQHKKAVFDIIDEAKKAFPVLDIGETANDLLEGLGAFHLAVIVWKKDWLGDGK